MKSIKMLMGGGIFATLFLIGACRKDYQVSQEDLNLQAMSGQGQIPEVDGAPTVLGAAFTVPFRLDIMQRAKDSLVTKNILPPHNFTVRPTHLYVKFTPNTVEQLEVLERDSTIDISAVPKHHLIAVQGSWYRAPGIQDGTPNPQYASLKIGYNFPSGISFEILDTLYVPDEDVEIMTAQPKKAECWYVDHLLAEAFRIASIPGTDVEHLMPVPDPWDDYTGGGGGTPPPVHGVIRVWDNRLGALVPLEGVKVERRRHSWSTANSYGYTNEDGEYSLIGTQSSGSSHYKIRFSRNGFNVNDRWLDRYEINQKDKSRHSFSLNIEWNTYSQFCATVFRAAYRYYYGDVDGLKRPFRTGVFLTQQRIIAADRYGKNMGVNYVALPILYVYRFENAAETDQYESDEIFSTTIHELAHTAHVLTMTNVIDYVSVSEQIRESWAVGVEWHLTSKEYRERGFTTYGNETYSPIDPPAYPNEYGYQYWNKTSHGNSYTSLFINLVDNFNENGEDFDGRPDGQVNDQVFGYSLGSIQSNYLKHCYSHASLTPYLKGYKPVGVSNAQIDLLMSHY